MPALTTDEACERLAKCVEKAKPSILPEIYAELFPEKPAVLGLSADGLARHVRSGLEAEELVDLWHVVFPADRNVWYDEEDARIHYNEKTPGYAEAD
ncbi:hypothetical protein BH10PLA2_BH10PLA2_39000 [soil metagenome]